MAVNQPDSYAEFAGRMHGVEAQVYLSNAKTRVGTDPWSVSCNETEPDKITIDFEENPGKPVFLRTGPVEIKLKPDTDMGNIYLGRYYHGYETLLKAGQAKVIDGVNGKGLYSLSRISFAGQIINQMRTLEQMGLGSHASAIRRHLEDSFAEGRKKP